MELEPQEGVFTRSEVRVRIAGEPVSSGEPRLYVTEGLEDASGRVVDGIAYRAGALVPAPHWRPARRAERLAVISSDPGALLGSTIDIVPAPPALEDLAGALGSGRRGSIAECEASLRSHQYLAGLHRALPTLHPLVASEVGLQLLGTCVQRGDLWSTTTHLDRGGGATFSGLHVDNWDKRGWGEKHLGRRQMCINLGVQDRFFVFAGVTVDALTRTGEVPLDGEPAYTGLVRLLLARCLRPVIYRVRVRPGEMYLAPTDNLIHDGMTSGNDCPDVTLNLRGYFRPPAANGGV